jgi:signal transduction histidine kinase
MLLMAAALGWLGWLLLEKDRELSQQRIQERLDSAADLAAAVVVQKLAEAESALITALPSNPSNGSSESTSAPGDQDRANNDILTVTFTKDGVSASRTQSLIYSPFVPAVHTPHPSTFADGEAVEFLEQNPLRAAAIFNEMTESPNSAIRAGALLRAARNLRKAGAARDALAAYNELARLGATPVDEGGLPAELAARSARLTLFQDLGQQDACEQDARALYMDLQNGRWLLSFRQWDFYTKEARRWFRLDREAEARERDKAALAEAVGWLWQEWQRTRNGDGRSAGRTTRWIDDHPFVVFWRGDADSLTALATGRRFIETDWRTALRPIAERHSVHFTLMDANGGVLIGSNEAARSKHTVRSLAGAHVPWTLRAEDADPGRDLAALAVRRYLFLAGLAMAGLLVLTGGWFVARSLSRELEVARLKSDFVAAVSHEFRTPLASLRQMSEMLADGRVSSEERRQGYYHALSAESDRLHRLVEDLLDFGRMDAGAQAYRFEMLAPHALVRSVSDEFAARVREKGYRVQVMDNGKEELPAVRADRQALTRVLWNLLDNAVKYSPDSHTVWVETGREGDSVTIRVRDEGVGIAAAEQREIFKKFVRAGAAKALGIKGTGIGLAMANEIVAAHGGRIEVASRPGAGSTFTIRLPGGRGAAV